MSVSPINRLDVEIAGEPYVLKSEASIEHMEKVVRLVQQKIKEAKERNNLLPPIKTVVAAALNIADEYLQLKANHEQLLHLIEVEQTK